MQCTVVLDSIGANEAFSGMGLAHSRTVPKPLHTHRSELRVL